MEIFLGKLTQNAMNYAIRSGIAITSTYAINQVSRLLKTADNSAQTQELQDLKDRLDSKIRIISPAIDMIELISARGNTSLESAVSLTKALRWDIQSLATRIATAAGAGELSRRGGNQAKTRPTQEAEIRFIINDMKRLLLRIEDAVPLINLAITTSGASLSTTLPATVSPSRLLQASTFLTAGDSQFSMLPTNPVQVGPAFILSVYMLFSGHAHRARFENGGVRDNTWKEVIHKARVKLMRIPLETTHGLLGDSSRGQSESQNKTREPGREFNHISGKGRADEFAYQLEIVEDLDDDRIHTFEDDEPQPRRYGDVQLAGITETVPIYEISKIFYADTGKILNIGSDGEPNAPILLLKRDVNALPPRKMMADSEQGQTYEESDYEPEEKPPEDDLQGDIDFQIRRESLENKVIDDLGQESTSGKSWHFPPNLDDEWLAFEVYTESDEASSEDEQNASEDSIVIPEPPSSSDGNTSQASELPESMSRLHIDGHSASPSSTTEQELASSASLPIISNANSSPFGPIRSSLSLLEMLIRLTALQQFQQASHLSIHDELLNFFLEESSTTGAGGDGDERRQKRNEARQKVGFDPYDESPIKRRGEEYQYHDQARATPGRDSMPGTPYYGDGEDVWYPRSRERTTTPQASPESWLKRSLASSRGASELPSSPRSPYVPVPSLAPSRRATKPIDRVQSRDKVGLTGSPLGRGREVSMDAHPDSSLGTSPGSPAMGKVD